MPVCVSVHYRYGFDAGGMLPLISPSAVGRVFFLCYTLGFDLPVFHRIQPGQSFLAQATPKRAAAARRKKAPASSKATAAAKGSGRIASKRATATSRGSGGTQKKGASAHAARTAAATAVVNAASLGHMARLFREVGGILCLFAALIALLALVSFDTNDPGWSHTGTGVGINNSVGRVGAWFADVSMYLFGFMAYLIPLVIGVSGWLLFRNSVRTSDTYRPFVFVRLIGVALMLVSASGLADLHASVGEGVLPQGTFGGGILGTAVAWRLVPFLQHLGTTLVLLAAFFSSLTLAFGTSWLRLIELIGGAVVGLIDGMRDRARQVALAHDEHSRILAADKARDAHVKAQEREAARAARDKPRGIAKSSTRKAGKSTDLDPLLAADADNLTGASLATGMGAALAMARDKARASQALAGKAVNKVSSVTDRSDKFDVLGDSLANSDALLADDFDQTVQMEPPVFTGKKNADRVKKAAQISSQ